MSQKIYKKSDSLIIEIPLHVNRHNPYEESSMNPEGITGEMDNLVGVIYGTEMGFSHWIDMDYADKSDQISDLFFKYYGGKDDFMKLCKGLGIQVVDYPLCKQCEKPILGTSVLSKIGFICYGCDLSNERGGK